MWKKCIVIGVGTVCVGYAIWSGPRTRETKATKPLLLKTPEVILFAADVCEKAYRKARDTGETAEDLAAMGVKQTSP